MLNQSQLVLVICVLIFTHGVLFLMWRYQRHWRRHYEKMASENYWKGQDNLKEPIWVSCALHGKFKGFGAKLMVGRDACLIAPSDVSNRVLFRLTGEETLVGAPNLQPLVRPLKLARVVGGDQEDYLIVLNMLGVPYYMRHEDIGKM